MTECQVCGGKSQLFLCRRHLDEFRDILLGLPRWIRFLSDAAVCQTRMGDGGPTSPSRDVRGDDAVLPKCTCGHPEHAADACTVVDAVQVSEETLTVDEDGDEHLETVVTTVPRPCVCEDYQPAVTQSQLRNQALRAGKVNAKASKLAASVHDSLNTVMRQSCDHRGLTRVPRWFIGPLTVHEVRGPGRRDSDIALWLAPQVNALAADPDAGEWFRTLSQYVEAIENAINRPIPTRFLGKCPTWVERTQRACGTELRCQEGIVEVTCPACRHSHNTDRLQLLMMGDLERKKLTIDKILELNRTVIPEEFRINERTLRRWRSPGPDGEAPKLRPRGYRRPDGREAPTRHSEDDIPLFLWSDVTRLRSEKPRRKVKA